MIVGSINTFPQPDLSVYGFSNRDWRMYLAVHLPQHLVRDATERKEEELVFRPFKVYVPKLDEHPVAIRTFGALAALLCALHPMAEAMRSQPFAKPPPAPTGQRRGHDGSWYGPDVSGRYTQPLIRPELAPWTEDSKQAQMEIHYQWTYLTVMWCLVSSKPVLLDTDGEPFFVYTEERIPTKTSLATWFGLEEPETERFSYSPRVRLLLDSEEYATSDAYLEHMLGRISPTLEEGLVATED